MTGGADGACGQDGTALERLAALVRTAPGNWTAQATDRALFALADTLAVAQAAQDLPLVRRSGPGAAMAGSARIWWSDRTADPESAAFANAVAAHALDYDDVATPWRGHPSAVILPALAAVAGSGGADRDHLLDAYVVGYEIGARIGEAMMPDHYRVGWHATATIGPLAAAAAIARMQCFDSETTVAALSIAALQSAGMQVAFGTDGKSLQAGFAAVAALRACRLAEAGLSGPRDALEGAGGFAELHAGRVAAMQDIGAFDPTTPPRLRDTLETKLYPSCYATHRALVAVGQVLRDVGPFAPRDIRAVEVIGSPGSHDPLMDRYPRSAAEAQFHMPTLVAMALSGLPVSLSSLAAGAFARPDVVALAGRIDVREADDGRAGRRSTVRVVHGEHEASATVDAVPMASLDSAAWQEKLRDCTTGLTDPLRSMRHEIERTAGREAAAVFARTAIPSDTRP